MTGVRKRAKGFVWLVSNIHILFRVSASVSDQEQAQEQEQEQEIRNEAPGA